MGKKEIDFYKRIGFTLPVLTLFILFVVYPFLSSLYYSVTDWNGVSRPNFTGLQNYIRLFNEGSFTKSVINTLLFCVTNFIIVNPLSFFIALALNREMRGRSILRAIYYLPAVLSLTVMSVIWSLILNYYGSLNELFKLVGLSEYIVDWLTNFNTALPSLLFICVWKDVGFYAVIYLAGLQSIPKDLIESSQIDGIGRWNKLRYIILPLLMPSITVVTFLGLSGYLRMFDLPYILTNGGPGDATMTMALLIYNQAFKYNTFGYATASGIVLFIMVSIISLLQVSFTRSKEVEI